MVLIATVSGLLLAFFLAVGVVPWLVGRLRDGEVAPDGPDPFGADTAWLAIRTADIDRVIRVLGLTNVQMANWRTGLGITTDTELSEYFVFVTPPVEGWTFVVGLALPHPVSARFTDRCLPLLIALGKEFNEIQYYFSYSLIDFYAWSRFADAKLRRSFAWGDEGVIWNRGALTGEERRLGLKVFEAGGVMGVRNSDIDDDETGYPGEEHVLKMAEVWSLDPRKFGRLPSDPALGYVGEMPVMWRPEREARPAQITEPPTLDDRPRTE